MAIAEEFSKLTEFMHSEVSKESESFGISNPSKKIIKFIDKGTMDYAKLYSKYLFRKEKRKIQLEEAIDTMPHGFWWKIFHSNLWAKIKMLEKEKDLKSVKEEVRTQIEETIKCYPVVVQRASVPEVFEDDEDEQEE